MTVNSTTSRIAYLRNGTANPLPVSFPFQAQSDLVVIETVTATGLQSVKALGSDYTITGTTDANGFYPNGGSVVPAAANSNVMWTIYRDPPITQLVEHVDNDPIPAASLDNPTDKLTMISQRLKDRMDRALVLPDGDPAVAMVVPTKVDRAGKLAAYDATTGAPVASSVTLAAVEALNSSGAQAQLSVGFDTLAALTSAASGFADANDGTTSVLLGYNSKFDGAGGLIRLTKTPSESANGVTTYSLGSGWYAERVIKEPVNLAWSGVKPGVTSLKVTTTSGSNSAAITDGSLTAAAVGKDICIYGAGTDSGNGHEGLFTTITGVSGSTITLNDNAAASQTSVPADVGYSARSALQTAINTLVDAGYRKFTLKGDYLFDNGCWDDSNTHYFGQFLFIHGADCHYDFRGARIYGCVQIGDVRDLSSGTRPTLTVQFGELRPLGDAVDHPYASFNAVGATMARGCVIDGAVIYARNSTRGISVQTTQAWGVSPYTNIDGLVARNIKIIGDADYPATTGIDISCAKDPNSTSVNDMIANVRVEASIYNTWQPIYVGGDAGYPFGPVFVDADITDTTGTGTTEAIRLGQIHDSKIRITAKGVNGRGLRTYYDIDASTTINAWITAGASPGDYGALFIEDTSGDTRPHVSLFLDGAWTTASLLPQANGVTYDSVYIKDAVLGIKDGGDYYSTFGRIVFENCTANYASAILGYHWQYQSDAVLLSSAMVPTVDDGIAKTRLKSAGSTRRPIARGVFTANGSTEVTISNTAIATDSELTFSLRTVGGTPAGSPYISTAPTAGSVGVKAAAGDTSDYNYTVWEPL